jgi:hypothetical protein
MSDGSDEPIVVPIEAALDLHAFAPRDVLSVVDATCTRPTRRGSPRSASFTAAEPARSELPCSGCSPGTRW